MRVNTFEDDPNMFHYYTGSPGCKVLIVFLGPALDSLFYSQKAANMLEVVANSYWCREEGGAEYSNK